MTDAREAALEELYASTPEAFAAKRDVLARKLVKDGDPDAAAAIKARRKPTQLAYVLNQLARKHPEDLAELVDIGRELARAQRGAVRGGRGPDLREAIGRQRSAITRLSAKTGALMRGLGMSPDEHAGEIASALQAALVDPAIGAALEEGRLEKAPGPAVGFPEIAPTREAHVAASKAKDDAHRERTQRELEATEERAAEAEHEAEAAEGEARAREDAAEALTKKSGELAAEARRLAAEEKRILGEAKKLAKAADAATRAAKEARATAARKSADAARARRAAERASKKT